METISNLICFFIIEDLKNQELIYGMFFDFSKTIESIKKENINTEKKLQKKILNKVIEEFDKFVQDNVNFYLQNEN